MSIEIIPPSGSGGGIGGTTGTTDNAILRADGAGGATLQSSVVTVDDTTGSFSFNTDAGVLQFGASKDVVLSRGGADILEQKRGANAQTLNVYNTFTDGSNNGRCEIGLLGSVGGFDQRVGIACNNLGSAPVKNLDLGTKTTGSIVFFTSNTFRWLIDLNGNFTTIADNAYDIGASGASRPRDVFIARNLNLSGVPTSDPHVVGEVWSNLGIATISAG